MRICDIVIMKLRQTKTKGERTMAKRYDKVEYSAEDEGFIMRSAMKKRSITQVDLADKLGVLQSSLSGSINRKRLSLEVFCRILNAMEYDVVVVDRKTEEPVWKVAVK